MPVPSYTGTVALLIGIVVTVLKAAGVTLPDSFGADATSAVVAVITAVSMIIGVWRLLHTKKVADTANAQLVVNGIAPLQGHLADKVLTESDKLNAAEIVRKATA